MILKQVRTTLLVAGFILAISQSSYADLMTQITINGVPQAPSVLVSGTALPIDIDDYHFTITGTQMTGPGVVPQLIFDATASYSYGGSAQTISIAVAGNNFTVPGGTATATSTFTGTFPGSASAIQAFTPGNTLFTGPSTCPAEVPLNGVLVNPCSINSGSPFTLTDTVTITLTSGQTANFNVTGAVPEPPAMLLFGVGLLGVGVWGRKRFAK